MLLTYTLFVCLYHLETPASFARILFLDFSSAFNTMQPHLLCQKLLNTNVHPDLIRWVLNFLVNRGQCVRVGEATSTTRHTSTGAPQGTVTAPILFTTYTNDMRGPDDDAIAVKFADDTALADVSNNDDHFEEAVTGIEQWCEDHYLELNVKKTEEVVVDFRRKGEPIRRLKIKGEEVKRVDKYKYLGVQIDRKLTFSNHVDQTYKKCQQRLYLLRRLSRLHVNSRILKAYYSCHIESVLTYGLATWYRLCGLREKKKLDKVVNVGSKLCGMKCESVACLYEKRVRKKARKIVKDNDHILNEYFKNLPSGRRYQVMKVKKKRAKNTFISQAILLLNKQRH